MATNGIPEISSKGHLSVRNAGLGEFNAYLKARQASVGAIAASFLKPERLTKVALACVSRTPALQNCTMESIFRSVMQAAELGLEPGSALGEAYLVPYKSTCQMIVGYRGLISLAFRSGHIKSIQSREVYDGDLFEFELGLETKLRHVPGDNVGDPAKITHVYCVIHLKDGGIIADVMTKKEVERIRGRSAAGNSGPWVTDYAEMAKKTVTRRALKYAPMSVEMSKALALENAVDTGDTSALGGEFEFIDTDYTVENEPEKPATTGVNAVKQKVAENGQTTLANDDPDPEEARKLELIEIIAGLPKSLLLPATAIGDATKEVAGTKLSVSQLDTLTIDQLRAVNTKLREIAKK